MCLTDEELITSGACTGSTSQAGSVELRRRSSKDKSPVQGLARRSKPHFSRHDPTSTSTELPQSTEKSGLRGRREPTRRRPPQPASSSRRYTVPYTRSPIMSLVFQDTRCGCMRRIVGPWRRDGGGWLPRCRAPKTPSARSTWQARTRSSSLRHTLRRTPSVVPSRLLTQGVNIMRRRRSCKPTATFSE